MQKSSPKYRINYLYCKQKLHSDQKTNMVCLSQQCQQNSLVCSLCLEDKHKGHQTKPLKHFLEGLERHYSQRKNSTINVELEELEQGRLFFMSKIREAVEGLAQKFMQLQGEVMEKYELIKGQILEREAKRSRFSSFYDTMAIQGRGDPNFQIQNYLHFQPMITLQTNAELDKFLQTSLATLQTIKSSLTIKKKDASMSSTQSSYPSTVMISQIQSLPYDNKFVLPPTIKRNGDVFVQTNPTTKVTLGYLNVLLKNWGGKLRVKVKVLPATSKLTFGVAKLDDIIGSKHSYPLLNQTNCHFIDSTGQGQKHEYNYITSMKVEDTIDIMVRKNNCKLNIGKNICCFHLYNKQDTAVFFAMDGVCQIQMVYPLLK